MSKKVFSIIMAAVILGLAIYIGFWNSGNVNAQNLMQGVRSNQIQKETLTDDFISATADFSISLFKKSISPTDNSLLSPVSVALALGMTANGAAGKTEEQFETLLGNGIAINQLSKYYSTLSATLQNDNANKVKLANSIWYRDSASLSVNPDFLQINANYFKAAAYKADFNSETTVKEINHWVKDNTDGMIDSIVDKINDNTVMYLINTVLFDAEWSTVYKKHNVWNGTFNTNDGQAISTDFMHSFERYLENDTAKGFIKPYKGEKYSFAAILPNEGISLEDYIQSLDGKSFINLLQPQPDTTASIHIPKFKYEYEISLAETLKLLGLTEAFDSYAANFSKMATSSDGNLFIGEVLHKTFIQVDELGTKAGAATKVEIETGSALLEEKKVTFDRPFVYAIIENETQLPVFIGTVLNPAKE